MLVPCVDTDASAHATNETPYHVVVIELQTVLERAPVDRRPRDLLSTYLTTRERHLADIPRSARAKLVSAAHLRQLLPMLVQDV